MLHSILLPQRGLLKRSHISNAAHYLILRLPATKDIGPNVIAVLLTELCPFIK